MFEKERSFFRGLACTAPVVLVGPFAFAQSPEGPPDPGTVLETEITVTATSPDLATIESISGRDIARRTAQDLVEALRLESGLSAVRRGPINLEPTVRGLQENQIGIFVDGTRTFAAGPARMDSDLSHVAPQAVQTVHVVKGPYALTWGAGTLSAIQVETMRPPFSDGGREWRGGLTAGYADNSSAVEGGANVASSGEGFRLFVGGSYRAGDDYEAGDGSPIAGDFESKDFRWNLGWQLSDSALLDYSGGYQEQFDLDYPGRILDATYFYTRSHNLELERVATGRIKGIRGNVYSSSKDHRMNNDAKPTALDMPGRIPPFGLRIDLPTRSDTAGARLALDLGTEGGWTVGADAYRNEQAAVREIRRRSNDALIFRDIVWPDADLSDVGVYVQRALRGSRASFVGTGRVDRVSYSAGEVSPFFLENATGPLDGDETNWSLALSTQAEIGSGWRFYAGAGRAVRTATTLERYSDRFPSTKFQIAAEFVGDPLIEPEVSVEGDLGVGRRSRDGVSLDFEIFWRNIDDYITVEPDLELQKRLPLSPPVVFRYRNGTGAEFTGAELRLEQTVGVHFRWRVVSSYVRADDELFDEPVLGIAPWTTVADVGVHTEERRFRANLQATILDDQNRVAAARFEAPTSGAEILDLQLAAEVTPTVLIRAGIRNLTDEAYAHHLNSPSPFTRTRVPEIGRQFHVSVRIAFGL